MNVTRLLTLVLALAMLSTACNHSVLPEMTPEEKLVVKLQGEQRGAFVDLAQVATGRLRATIVAARNQGTDEATIKLVATRSELLSRAFKPLAGADVVGLEPEEVLDEALRLTQEAVRLTMTGRSDEEISTAMETATSDLAKRRAAILEMAPGSVLDLPQFLAKRDLTLELALQQAGITPSPKTTKAKS